MDVFAQIYQFFLVVLKDPTVLLQTVGYLGLIAIIFAETGLLVGFFLPGDSILIAAGIFAAKGDMQLSILLSAVTVAAIVGDAVGFSIGKKLGAMLYQRPDNFFYKKKHIVAAQDFYAKHGGKTIVLARFLPIVRTFVPTVAGAAHMRYSRFFLFNVVGAFVWVWSMVLGGYFLGRVFGPKLNDYLHFILLGVIFVSFLPLLVKWITSRRK